MFKINRNSKLTFLSVLAILSLSTVMPALVFAAPVATSVNNWEYVNGNSWAWNYSPQTQINKDNVNNVEVKWIFPLAGKTGAMDFIVNDARGGGQGSTTPPLVVNGVVYIETNYYRTYAVDAATGKQLWTYDYVIDIEDVQNRLPVNLGLRPHFHGFRYWEGGNAILLNGLACDFFGIDATTGKNSFWVKDLCKNVPGNLYDYYSYAAFTATSSLASIGTYDAGRQFIIVIPGSVHGSVVQGDGRHVTLGINMDTHDVEWRVFSFPPHGVLTKDWALQECDIGFFRDIPCNTVKSQALGNLEWDWAQPNQPPSIYAGVTANWGQAVVDEDTGILYTQTGNQGPYPYIGETPGPRLYGSTIYAVDMNTGQRIWWNQPMPRDPYDYDCNWSGILAELPTLGKVYMKGCKEGNLQVLDAETGKPIYNVDVVEEQVAWGQVTAAALTEPFEGKGGVKYHQMDPLSTYDMREMLSGGPDNKYGPQDVPRNVYPAWSNGLFATDMSFDPDTNTLYHYAQALETSLVSCSSAAEVGPGGSYCVSKGGFPTNTTVVARDAVTGTVKWTWYYDPTVTRSAMAVTKDIVALGLMGGSMMFFDKTNGNVLKELVIGSDLGVGITTGLDSNGDQKYFTMVGNGFTGTGITPTLTGTLVAVGLSDSASNTGKTTTVTTTAINTVTAEGSSEGLSPTITYAAVAVAVIAVIAAAVLFTRKTK